MLDLLDTLGIADNTFVMFSTDNGPHMNSWPDGGITPFRSANWAAPRLAADILGDGRRARRDGEAEKGTQRRRRARATCSCTSAMTAMSSHPL
jgi:hypothetical protein